eukprot:gb/GEZJ01004291.1/.p1 GENE.gb/GEZJ01004291.1/~~gb/GEZJ01004291.1/.p1  ORF type:complete len:189 (-),score=19.47 gb/GEZJ01004291.1/:1642-2208(-)
MKTVSSQRADREGPSADGLADALFRVVMALKFERRAEKHVESFRKLLQIFFNGRGEGAMSSLILSADRGYGKELFMSLFVEARVESVFVMSDHLLKVYLFVALSYLNPGKMDEDVKMSESSIGKAQNGASGDKIGPVDETAAAPAPAATLAIASPAPVASTVPYGANLAAFPSPVAQVGVNWTERRSL